MTNAITPITSVLGQVPAHIQSAIDNAPARLKKGLTGAGGIDYPRISLKGSRFTLMQPGKDPLTTAAMSFKAVIVDTGGGDVGRIFYEGTYDPNAAAKGPACWSHDGQTPAADAKSPQGSLCQTCPQNVKGSSGHDRKACAYKKNIAVVAVKDPDRVVYQLSLSGMTLFDHKESAQGKGFGAFVDEVISYGLPLDSVVAEIGFDSGASVPKLLFKVTAYTDDEMLAFVRNYQNTQAATLRKITSIMASSDAVLPNPDVPAAPAQAAPAQAAPAQAAPAQAAPAPAAAPEPVQAAPAQANGFGVTTPLSEPATPEPAAPTVPVAAVMPPEAEAEAGAEPASENAAAAVTLDTLNDIVGSLGQLDLPTA